MDRKDLRVSDNDFGSHRPISTGALNRMMVILTCELGEAMVLPSLQAE